jgi:aminomethyltransferase
MPIPTPFYSRISALSTSQDWRDWSGYFSIAKFHATHEHEYYAVRNAAGLLDISPLYKYDITGPDALSLVDRIMTRDIKKCRVNQVMYSSWCDEEGKVIDDGTIARLEENHFRITAADPSYRWFVDCGYGMNANVKDVSTELAALSIQGPKSLGILNEIVNGNNLNSLRYYWLTQANIDTFPITISRTGYTGDLGFELWIPPEIAEKTWDILLEVGRGYGITPIGLTALDMLRIEAGLLLIDVDYQSTLKALINEQKSSPFEIGLGWTVDLESSHFIGRKALRREKELGVKWAFVGFDVDWVSLEEKYGKVNLPPQLPTQASRDPVPIYRRGKQVGQATSITFSPILKKMIAIGTIERQYVSLGSQVEMEITVEYTREVAKATITKPQFFNPKRKRAVHNG